MKEEFFETTVVIEELMQEKALVLCISDTTSLKELVCLYVVGRDCETNTTDFQNKDVINLDKSFVEWSPEVQSFKVKLCVEKNSKEEQ